jgi:hypothetical protein
MKLGPQVKNAFVYNKKTRAGLNKMEFERGSEVIKHAYYR